MADLEKLVSDIQSKGEIVRQKKEAGEDIDDLVFELNELKCQLPEGHELGMTKSGLKKHEKTKMLREKGKGKKKDKENIEAKQGEGKNVKMAKKMQEQEKFVNTTPAGEKKDLSGEMAKTYDPEAVEAAWYAWWEKNQYFKPRDDDKDSEPFVIVIPPPNVTGSLHLGHAITSSIEDCLVRWHRMQGHNTLWVPGLDHAGIATQVVVEKQLWKTEQKTRHEIGREAFLKKTFEWKEQKGNHILKQFRLLGASCDWDREHFTMDEQLSVAVRESFCRLYEKGIIYRAEKLIDWCVPLQSVISKIEIENIELEGEKKLNVPGYDKPILFGFLFEFAYKVVGSDEEIVVATTRPETMLGDTAVAVHPEDPRYKHLQGKLLQHPFVDRQIPVIADDILVDMNFGTGAVKITPAHDPNDYTCGKRHNLKSIDVMTDHGLMNSEAGEFEGMKRFDCRYAVMEKLEKLGFKRGYKPNKMVIPTCQRTHDVLEPRLKPQWYCDCTDMAKRALEVVEKGDLKLIPQNPHTSTWNHWLGNIQDWCISRQLWWGHRIPAWFADVKGQPKGDQVKDTNRWIVARDEAAARKEAAKVLGCSEDDVELTQDPDVLDTWYSSGLFPFSVMGWPNQTQDMKMYYPGNLLETGYDILFFWVARMVMFGLELADALPFTDVFLHTLVRDKYGKKMSKSLGNVIDPLWVIYGITLQELHDNVASGNLVEREVKRAQELQTMQFPSGIAPCGADGLRFALLINVTHGSDINLDINCVVTYRQFCNKIWNATKFVIGHISGGFEPAADVAKTGLGKDAPLVVRWILSRLNAAVKTVNQSLKDYDFNKATQKCYGFFVEEFCDVFLEYAKRILNDDAHPQRPAMIEALYTVLESTFRLMHPFLPFLTEELWQRLPRRANDKQKETIVLAPFPVALETDDADAERDMDIVLHAAHAMRATKAQYKMEPKATPEVFLRIDKPEITKVFETVIEDLRIVARVGDIQLGKEAPKGCALAKATEDVAVQMVLTGNVNAEAEIAKIEKTKVAKGLALEKLRKEMADEVKYSKKPQEKRDADVERIAVLEKELTQCDIDIQSFQALLG